MTHTGTTAFLRQAHRNNWEQYLTALRPGAAPGWDICVLTASDERQAEMYRCQLNWRREAGLLPAGMHFLVLPDPGGRRMGSGGATLNALAQVACLVAENEGGPLDALQRVLIDPLRRRFQAAAALLGDGQALRPRAARRCPTAAPPPSSTSS